MGNLTTLISACVTAARVKTKTKGREKMREKSALFLKGIALNLCTELSER